MSFLFLGVFFVCLVGGAVYTGQMEQDRLDKARAHRAGANLAAGVEDVSEE